MCIGEDVRVSNKGILVTDFQVFVARVTSAFFNGVKPFFKLMQFGALLLTAFCSLISSAAFSQDDPFPIIEWQKRLTADERLTAFGHDLMGDSIDTHIGSLVFSHTDVSLPGNSNLEVAVRRKRTPGALYDQGVNVDFGDWELDIPRITGITTHDGWAGNRCNGTWEQNFPNTSWLSISGGSITGGRVERHSYSNGVSLSIPGQGSQQVLKGASNKPGVAYTVNEWYLSCTQASDGGEGFIAHAPNGDKYYFDKFITRAYSQQSFARRSASDLSRNKSMFLASKVEDVNGNWVTYTYDNSNRLTQINANDGRKIQLAYSGLLISSVTANGRQWTYNYRDNTHRNDEWGQNPFQPFNGKVLSRVTRPDNLFWEFSLDGMQAQASPPSRTCSRSFANINLTHPNGTVGNYELRDTQHRQAYKSYTSVIDNCFDSLSLEPEAHGGSPTSGQGIPDPFEVLSSRVMSVTSKTLSHPTMETAEWLFSYEEDDECYGLPSSVCDSSTGQGITRNGATGEDHFANCEFCFGTIHNVGQYIEPSPAHTYVGQHSPQYDSDQIYSSSGKSPLDFTNQTRVTQPDGTIIDYYHFWEFEEVFGGKEFLRVIHDNGVELDRVESKYSQHSCHGAPAVHKTGANYNSSECPTHLTQTQTRRDGDIYTVESEYNMNSASSDYSYGNPIKMTRFSNVSTTPRTTETTYEHNASKWILGLPKTVTQNDREITTYDYDTFGRKTSQTRYGAPYQTFTYHTWHLSKGLPFKITDALGRRTELREWKRGIPQKVVRAAATNDETTSYQFADDNGWVTGSKDAMGRTTSYTRDNMGRLTLIDPTGNYWATTKIDYDFSGTGAVQTITKGQGVTTISYDAMFRPVIERSQALDTGWSSYTNTTYDGLGRVVFKSQPSLSSTETKGVDYTYDGLGRITKTRENITPFAETTTTYHKNHRRRVKDPSGALTDYYSYGYDGPGSADIRAISNYSDGAYQRWTSMVKNVHGQLTRLAQAGSQGGVTVAKNQYFYYDSQQRLCRHYVPEHGATKYQYDAAGQMTAYAKGQNNSGCGAIPEISAKVSQSYDELGRPITTNFADPATPDIVRTYDDNGNVLSSVRDDISWTYTYNNADLLTHETLSLDGKSFPLTYSYNASKHMTARTNPTRRAFDYAPDGLGRPTGVTGWGHSYASNMTYHASGALTRLDYGNGQKFTRTLNNRLLPERLLSVKDSFIALDQTLAYDARGKVTSIIDGAVSGNNRTYGYDGLGQLTSASGPWGTGSYKYDSLGNLRQKKLGSRTVNLSYNGRNRLSQSADTGTSGTRTVAYDVRGNVTTLGNLSFMYDASDQPVVVNGTANGVGAANGEYIYDGNLKRVKSVVNGATIYNVYDAAGTLVYVNKLAHAGNSEEKIDYVHAAGMNIARANLGISLTYLHSDHLGSLQAATRTGDSAAFRERYTPFGEAIVNTASNDNLAGFTGHIKDKATGLNYMQARYYDPVIGRFLSIDPVTFMDTGNPAMFNRYAYTWNDPVNLVDRLGTHPTGTHPKYNRPAPRKSLKEEFTDIGNAITNIGSAVANAVNPPAEPDREKAEERISGGAKPDKKKGRNRIYDSPPTGETADEIFGEISDGDGVETESKTGPRGDVEVVTLPDGSRVIDRNSTTGPRTIETQDAKGRTRSETRFPKDDLK